MTGSFCIAADDDDVDDDDDDDDEDDDEEGYWKGVQVWELAA